jgi:hypothetical protein
MRRQRTFHFIAATTATALVLSCTFVTNLIGGESTQEATSAPSDAPFSATEAPTEAPVPSGGAMSTAGWPCFTSSWGAGFTFCYPPDSILEEIPPDGAHIDLPVAPGTNLGSKGLDIIAIAGASSCEAANFPSGNPVTTVNVNGIDFLSDHGADAGAGSAYEWVSYAAMSGDTCVRLTFVLGSANAMMFDPPVPEFDHAAETAVFDAILSTFAWGG